jgi:polysaccharide export outer membrane protein
MVTIEFRYAWRSFSIGVLALSLAACGGPPKPLEGSPTVSVVSTGVLPAPRAEDTKSNDQAYRIGAFDKLQVIVYGMDELSLKDVQTDVSGHISFPLIGAVQAGGRTPAELQSFIEERLRAAYIRDPHVTVNLVEAASETVSVDGQVAKPGVYPVIARMTLMQAVASASGATENAKLDDVVLFRTVDGQRYAALYNMKAIRRGAYEDPRIFPNDIVIVGESSARRLFRDILQTVPLLTTPLIVALQNNN